MERVIAYTESLTVSIQDKYQLAKIAMYVGGFALLYLLMPTILNIISDAFNGLLLLSYEIGGFLDKLLFGVNVN